MKLSLNINDRILTAKAVVSRRHRTNEGIDSSSHQTLRIRLPASFQSKDNGHLYNALLEHFHVCCYCEHDCCGHQFGGVDQMFKLSRRDVSVSLGYWRNV